MILGLLLGLLRVKTTVCPLGVQARGRLVLGFYFGKEPVEKPPVGTRRRCRQHQRTAARAHCTYKTRTQLAPPTRARPASHVRAQPRTRTRAHAVTNRQRTRAALPRPRVDARTRTRVHHTHHVVRTAHQSHTPCTHSNARALSHSTRQRPPGTSACVFVATFVTSVTSDILIRILMQHQRTNTDNPLVQRPKRAHNAYALERVCNHTHQLASCQPARSWPRSSRPLHQTSLNR